MLPGESAFSQDALKYSQRLRSDGFTNAGKVTLNQPSWSTMSAHVLLELDALEHGSRDWFDLFAAQSCALKFFERQGCVREIANRLNSWARSAIRIGAFEECVRISDLNYKCFADSERTTESVDLSLDRAKAFRNLGDFTKALIEYRRAIRLAADLRDEAALSISLLLVGKLHGNYRGQHSLFAAFVGEARSRLKRYAAQSGDRDNRTLRYIAVCDDALGQAFRTSDPRRAEHYFREALRSNRAANRGNGVSRSLAHLTCLRFYNGKNDREKHRQLKEFEVALESTRADPFEQAGMAVRWLEYAVMLRNLGRYPDAGVCLRESRRIAKLYGAHKVLIRATVAESEMVDEAEAFPLLEEARALALQYRLRMQLSEVNNRIANLTCDTREDRLAPGDLIEENRGISLEILDEVRAALFNLHHPSESEPEFALMSSRTRRLFRSTLLQDYENAIGQLDRTVTGAAALLHTSERRRQEVLVFAVMSHVARELVHEVKISLDDEKEGPLARVATDLGGASDHVFEVARSLSDAEVFKRDLETIAKRLNENAKHVRDTAGKLAKLKAFLAQNLRRPRNLDQWVSVAGAAKTAISELRGQYSEAGFRCDAAFDVDVQVRSSAELITTVVQNLVRNAIQTSRNGLPRPSLIRLSMEIVGEIDDPAEIQEPLLRITSIYSDAVAAAACYGSIEAGLARGHDGSVYSSGVDFDLAKAVLVDLMGCSIKPFLEDNSTVLAIIFKLTPGRARIIDLRASEISS